MTMPMPIPGSEDETTTRQRDALARLDSDKRRAYLTLLSGLAKLEAALPAECNEETSAVIGDTIARCKAAEKFASDVFHSIVDPWSEEIKLQRDLWKPIGERANALMRRAEALADKLLAEERRRRDEADAAARALVAEKMREQSAAEAQAMAADSEAAAAEAKKRADEAWASTRAAVQSLDRAPTTTRVSVGEAVVFESSRLDFEVVDMSKFAAAHPELLEVRRGPTLAALRAALAGSLSLPETLPGWPGVKLRLKKATSSRA